MRGESVRANFDEENPYAQISSGLLVQADEGIPPPVVDLIGVIYRNLPRFLKTTTHATPAVACGKLLLLVSHYDARHTQALLSADVAVPTQTNPVDALTKPAGAQGKLSQLVTTCVIDAFSKRRRMQHQQLHVGNSYCWFLTMTQGTRKRYYQQLVTPI
ncbi:hypothetical protein F511_14396 [Dorcoceras hygrometricum]|uniref:Uncharacterized protein n=1 Tax=Dorcoceras hygrometricum TaxID=472368 RepID=A0A2Z7BNW9_9LAMI|nr:hypothetical protein F511_14396 [Dorcoceras hygrometricum]